MQLNAKQSDRAVGALLGAAAGDTLGVPYEFGMRKAESEPQMLGGGLGGIEPGQWSDDTELACAIALVSSTGADLRTEEALDAIAAEFSRWYAGGPPDVGVQTRAVLSQRPANADAMRAAARELHERSGRTAGNGSLIRTSPVALAHLGDSQAIAAAARAVSELTHHDPVAGDACVLWCLAIDLAVRTGRLDVRVGLPYVDAGYWVPLLEEAETVTPVHYAASNGWVVAALLAAWSSVNRTSDLPSALITAVQGGGDTDTVAAITGALAGAAYGGSGVPVRWRRMLHGWPGLRARDLVRLAYLTAHDGCPSPQGWPTGDRLTSYDGADTRTVPHPDDEGVLLGAVGALRPGVADAVVSLCRLGASQVPLKGVAPEDHVEVWLVDEEDANNDLPTVLLDAAESVRLLREEGKTVLLHCVHGHTRTPVVAAAYGARLTGASTRAVLERVLAVLPSASPRRSIAAALHSLEDA
jgi:ADP-ribosyl-[dinitrogen reductase] hydrolase